MTRFTIDAPTLLHIVTKQLVVSPEHQLVAPHAIRLQALTLILGQVRAGELTEQEASTLHTRLTELKIRVLGDRVSRATSFRIANQQHWTTTFDAEYVAVTLLQADALVTVDPEMAAKVTGLVTLAPVSALTE